MGIVAWVGHYVIAAAVFGVLDAIWLGRVARPVYDRHMGPILAERPNMVAAVAFYAIFIAGLTHFVTHSAIADERSWPWLVGTAAFFGLVTYATFDLTSLAVLKDFPAGIVPIDMAWGATITTLTSVATVALSRLIPALH